MTQYDTQHWHVYRDKYRQNDPLWTLIVLFCFALLSFSSIYNGNAHTATDLIWIIIRENFVHRRLFLLTHVHT